MTKNLHPRRGDIFIADLTRDPLTRKSGVRPVVIIQNDRGNANSGSVIAAIVTGSRKKYLPTHVNIFPRHGVKRPSTILCEHIITIDKDCLLEYKGTVVNTSAYISLDIALAVSIGLKT